MCTNIHTINIRILCTEQKWDKICRKLTPQVCHSNKSSFKSVIMSVSGILQKQYIHGFKHDITIAPHSLVQAILHEFHDSKGYQGTICTFEAIGRLY